MRILFITTTNLAANPRLTKELQLATRHGFKATVIQFSLGNWSDEKTSELEKEFEGVEFIRLSALRRPYVQWVWSSVLEQVFRLFPIKFLNGAMLATAVSKRSLPILSALKKIRNPSFDWVIAHNPGAFYPAYYFAKKNKIKLGIDVEDYHPGESHDPGEIKRMKKLMQYVLPKSSYCSFASPLIKEMVETDITPAIPHKFVLLNGFPQDEFELQVEKKSGPLQCVWFSQFIDSHRGLENVIPVIDNFYPDIELHLAGNLVESFADKLLQNKKGIVYHGSLTQKELHMLLCRCDIGLAVEPGRDVNNQLAISNKLMAYAQAGLFIVASRTPAQDEFLSSSSLDYLQTDLSETDLKKQLQRLILNKEQLRETRKERFEKGKSYSWEKSSPALIKLWQQV